MASKRILFYCGGPHVAGVEILTLSIMKALRARGHRIRCVVNGWGDGDFMRLLREEDIDYDVLKLGFLFFRKPFWTFDTLLHYPGAVLRHRRLLRLFRPDLCWHVSYRTVLMLAPFLDPDRTLLHVHDQDRPSARMRWIYGLARRRVARFVGVSNFIGEHLARLGVPPEKVAVVLTGVEADIASNLSPDRENSDGNAGGSERVDHRVGSSLTDEPPRIGMVGQILERKGHEDLLQALHLLSQRGFAFRCLVFGKGDEPFLAQLRRRAVELGLEDRVEWRGFAPRRDIYRQLDLVVVPTRDAEPFGLVALEPAFWGLPVVASRTGGLIEVVADQVSGLLCNPSDPSDLAEKLERLLSDADLRRRLGGHARRRAFERFTLDRMIDDIEALIDCL